MDVMNSITRLLFDWDGTLADSSQLGFAAFQKTFATMGVAFPRQTYEATYSPSWHSMYEAMGLPREKWERADELWIEHYGEQSAPLVEGARDTISELHRKGYQLGIVSSGNDCRVERELNQLGLGSLFEAVVCNEHVINKKPDPEGLETAMRQLKSTPEQSCYVGDSPEDIQMGKNANVLTVGVRSAYPTSWKLVGAKPDIYLESLAELSIHF